MNTLEVIALERELAALQATVVNMVRAKLFRTIQTDDPLEAVILLDANNQDCVEASIELAQRLNKSGMHRVSCPLCEEGPLMHHENGFLLPDGLRLHLTGSKKARLCPAMKAARDRGMTWPRKK